jgi:glycine amidinotransferase/scyllo-inosamine-4-phosphate amidinotransferase 1
MKINSHNEWDTLKEVIVGSADNMTVGLEFSHAAPVSRSLAEKAINIAKKAHPGWYLDEVREDLENLCRILTGFGAKVFRPDHRRANSLFSTTDWSCTGKDLYNVRDLHIVVGDAVIVSSSPVKCRYFEPNAFHDIWYNYFEEGFKWITAPKPKLVGDYLVPYYAKGEKGVTREDVLHAELSKGRTEKYRKLLENEILFDAACTIRMGRDLIYLVSNTGNYKGAKWLQSVIGSNYKVHTTTAYRASHIDSTILPLRPGLVLLNSARVNSQNCLSIFDKWKKIYFEDVAPMPADELEFQSNVRDKVYRELKEIGVDSDLHEISSPWGGLNVFSLDSQTVLVQDRQKKLIRELEKNKLTVIPVQMRHCYTMLGGLHCATLDTVRESTLESYFD